MKLDLESEDQLAAQRLVALLVHKLGDAVDIEPGEFEALDGKALVMMDFTFDGPLKLRLVERGRG